MNRTSIYVAGFVSALVAALTTSYLTTDAPEAASTPVAQGLVMKDTPALGLRLTNRPSLGLHR
jgi:hypothetical protein